MVFQLLLFGITKDIIGSSPFAFPLEGENTAGNLIKQLTLNYPRLKDLNSLAIAVNGEYAIENTIINVGDEIALIPPVSGG
jgi:molybdopterin synthase sulfur carrier subunit